MRQRGEIDVNRRKGPLAAPSFAACMSRNARLPANAGAVARRTPSSRPDRSAETLERLRRALVKVARLLEHDPAFAPVFVRLEREIELEQARQHDDVLVRARAIVIQNEIGSSKRVTC